MEEVTYWRADDGTEFDDEEECRVYEFGITVKRMEGKVFLLDRQKRPLDLTDYSSYSDAWYIYLVNSKSAGLLFDCWPEFDNYFPSELHRAEAGLWAYDDRDDCWYHLGQRITEFQDEADECMSVINGGL